MNHYLLIATFGYDFSLTGWPVWASAGLGAGLAILLSSLFPLRDRSKVFIKVLAPFVMLFFLWFTRWLDSYKSPFFFYKYYHAQLDVAYIVTYAFGMAFCMDAIRAKEKTTRVFGIVATLVYLGVVPMMVEYFRGISHWYEVH
jgi:hypothetical protein